MYKHTDDKHGTKRIEMIEFDDGEYFDDFIAEVSEIAWGDSGAYEKPSGEIVCPREPYTVKETIEILSRYSSQGLAWESLSMWCGAGDYPVNDDTDEKMVLRRFMNDILKEVRR